MIDGSIDSLWPKEPNHYRRDFFGPILDLVGFKKGNEFIAGPGGEGGSAGGQKVPPTQKSRYIQ
jgi:hypothetical protein